MGYTTDFLGHINIDPVLNDAEVAYLTAFSQSRRFDRPGGPYDVPMNPYAEDGPVTAEGESLSRTAEGQPGFACDWVPCVEGCCLSYNGMEKFYQADRWLRYLIDHFLRPDALAAQSGLRWFDEFTFDHTLDGLIVGRRRDTREMFALSVEDNELWREVLVEGDPAYWDAPALAYEEVIDRDRSRRSRRRSARLRIVAEP